MTFLAVGIVPVSQKPEGGVWASLPPFPPVVERPPVPVVPPVVALPPVPVLPPGEPSFEASLERLPLLPLDWQATASSDIRTRSSCALTLSMVRSLSGHQDAVGSLAVIRLGAD